MATIELNADELRLATQALRSFESDFGHDEADVVEAIKHLLTKFETASSGAASTSATEAERLSASRRVPAPAAAVFRIITDPNGHVQIDGSGMLIAPQDSARVGAVGDQFRMDMDGPARGFPDAGTYTVINTITKYSDGSVLEWSVGLPDQEPIGHVYGFELIPVSDTETEVVHYYDWSGATDEWKERMGFPVIPTEGLEKTLENLRRALS